MNLSMITVDSFWGIELKQRHYQVHENNTKLVVLYPGRNYSCEMPTLYYAGTSALQSGFDLLVLEYGYQAARNELDLQYLPRVIEECVESVKPIIDNYEQVVFISKSLGTIVAGGVHERLGKPIKHIYLTPVERSIPYINASDGVVIYGTMDDLFTKELANQIKLSNTRRVIEISNADHALETNNVEENLLIQRSLVNTYLDFLNTLGE